MMIKLTCFPALIRAKGLFIIAVSVFTMSCATTNAFKELDRAVKSGNFDGALKIITTAQESNRPLYSARDAILLFLDKGLVEHFAGNFSDSSQSLLEAERLIEEAYTRSLTQSFLTFILNDTMKDYPGEDFEDIYLSIFNAINFYRKGNIEGALVEVRKLTMPSGKLEMLARRHEFVDPGGASLEELVQRETGIRPDLPRGPPVEFNNSALARFLSALFYQAIGNEDSARIEFDQLFRAFLMNPNVYNHPVPSAVEQSRNVPADMARLNVISFTGLSPIKEEEIVTHWLPFFRSPAFHIANFRLPRMVSRPSVIERIEVIVDGQNFYLELLEYMGAVVRETFAARYSNILIRTYIRTLIKYVAADIAAAEVARRRGDNWALLTAVAARVAFEATESADLRMARFLPNKAHVGGINLEPGIYDIIINFHSRDRVIYTVERKNFAVRAGGINLLDVVNLN